jgi:hypothetical protein
MFRRHSARRFSPKTKVGRIPVTWIPNPNSHSGVHKPWKTIMNLLDGAWAEIARLQNILRTASYDLAPTIELRIDRIIKRIADGDGAVEEDVQATKRAVATARRRERNRARLVRLHVIAPAANDNILAVDRNQDSQYHARDALRQIMTQTSARDFTMIIHLAIGYNGPDVARLVGLSEDACRKRVSRLRAEFGHLKAA